MELKDIKAVYFIGAGGIGMSAIARYFIHRGQVVAGYDKTPSDLTHQLEKEGMLIHYEEDIDEIPHACKNPKSTLVVYTPAIPATHKELEFFREGGFEIQKRAQVLGTLTRSHKAFALQGHMERLRLLQCVHTSCTRVTWTVMPSWAAYQRTTARTISFQTAVITWSLRPMSLTEAFIGCVHG